MISILMGCLSIFSGCGKKQRTLYHFAEEPAVKVSKLALPVVRGISVQKQGHYNCITWNPIVLDSTTVLLKGMRLRGYHVYAVKKGHFISKLPLTQKPLREAIFIDKNCHHGKDYCYVIQALFRLGTTTYHGPMSHITCNMKK